MGLKVMINSLEEVPEALRDFYVREGDGYILQADDKDYRSKINEFRNNNIDLVKKVEGLTESEKELAELQEKFKAYQGIDPEAAAEAMKKMEAIEEKTLIDAGQIDAVVEQRIERRFERLRADYEGKISALEKSLEQSQSNETNYRGKLESTVIDSALQSAVMGVGTPRKGAIQDIISRGKQVWKLDDNGDPIPMDGNDVMYGKDGKQPISTEEWAQSLLLDAPWLFEGNAGGGAGGNLNGGGDHGTVRLSDQDSINSNIEAIAKGQVVVSNQ